MCKKQDRDKHIYIDAETSEQLLNLRSERKKLGYKGKDMSEKLGISYNRYMQYETGIRTPPVRIYLQLAEILCWDVRRNPNWLFQQRPKLRDLRVAKKRYGYTNVELSKRTGLSKDCIVRFFKKKSERTPHVYVLLEQALEEARLAEIKRNKILGLKDPTIPKTKKSQKETKKTNR